MSMLKEKQLEKSSLSSITTDYLKFKYKNKDRVIILNGETQETENCEDLTDKEIEQLTKELCEFHGL